MNRVQELIIQALTISDNNQLRQQAENTIFTLLNNNPPDFFFTCARIVADSNKSSKIRQQAASVMKAVLPKYGENGKYFWDLAGNARGQVKEMLLGNLILPDANVMRASANVIAQIAAIEIARGEWLQIVAKFAENSLNEDANIRRASITTLGFICEELKNVKSNINTDTCEQILGSLLLGLQQAELAEISLGALRASIPFLRGILQNPDYSRKIFEFILPLMATIHTQKVYEVLYEYAKYCYHLLGSYLPTILQFTLEHLRQRTEVSIPALEFWDTVGVEYLKRTDSQVQRVGEQASQRNYLEELHDLLLPEIMQAILILNKEDLDHPELREAAVKALSTFVNCCGRNVVEKVTEGVSRVVGSGQAGERQASVLIFSSLCYYPDRDYVRDLFANGFPHLIRLVTDPEILVAKNSLSGLVILSESFPQVFQAYSDLYRFFLDLLRLSQHKDIDLQVLSLSVIVNITDVLRDYPNSILVVSPDDVLRELVRIFKQNLRIPQRKESNEKIIVIMMNILMATSKRAVLIMLLAHLIQVYGEFARAKMSDQQIVLAQIITMVHTCLLSLSKFPLQKDLKHDLKPRIYQLVDLHLSLSGVEQEGINMISALAMSYKRQFVRDQLDKYWPVVIKGLQWVDQKTVFKAALNCIADIARCDQTRVINKLSPIFQQLVNVMHQSADREIKIDILNCFGDLSIGMKSYGQVYMDTLIQICNQCFEAVYKFSEIEDERDYAEELKEALVDMYHCVVFAQNENSKTNARLAQHFPLVSTFIVRTCETRLKPTVDYLRMCLYVIFDSALFYMRGQHSDDASRILRSPEVQQLVTIMRKFAYSRKDVQELLEFIDQKVGINFSTVNYAKGRQGEKKRV